MDGGELPAVASDREQSAVPQVQSAMEEEAPDSLPEQHKLALPSPFKRDGNAGVAHGGQSEHWRSMKATRAIKTNVGYSMPFVCTIVVVCCCTKYII